MGKKYIKDDTVVKDYIEENELNLEKDFLQK